MTISRDGGRQRERLFKNVRAIYNKNWNQAFISNGELTCFGGKMSLKHDHVRTCDRNLTQDDPKH